VQGFMENLQHLKSSSHIARIHIENYLPMVFKGVRKLDVKALLVHIDSGAIDEDLLESLASEVGEA